MLQLHFLQRMSRVSLIAWLLLLNAGCGGSSSSPQAEAAPEAVQGAPEETPEETPEEEQNTGEAPPEPEPEPEPDSDGDGFLDRVDVDDDNDGLIEIGTLEELDWMRNDVFGTSLTDHDGNVRSDGCPVDGCHGYELIADLDFDTNGDGQIDAEDAYFDYDGDGSNRGWLGIGDAEYRFQASFYGNGHFIKNLTMRRESPAALFGHIDGDASVYGSVEIRDVHLDAVDIVSSQSAGSLATRITGVSVNNCHASGRVEGGTFAEVGGLIGQADSGVVIFASSSAAAVHGQTMAGGLVGFMFPSTRDTVVEHSSASGAVTSSLAAGGLVGGVSGDGASAILLKNLASGDVNASSGFAGGLLGYVAVGTATIEGNEARGNVSGDLYVGGLAGYVAKAFIFENFAHGDVSGTQDVGGLVGRLDNGAQLVHVAATGAVSGGDATAGLVGVVNPAESTQYLGFGSDRNQAIIEGAFTSSPVTSTGNYVGGLIGLSFNLQVDNSYAIGDVEGVRYVGGLFGDANTGSLIATSLAVGVVSGSEDVGALIGWSDGATYVSNYFANNQGIIDAIGTNHSDLSNPNPDGTTGAALAVLRCPTAANDSDCAGYPLYQGWDEAWDSFNDRPYWDFGSDRQLPALQIGGESYRGL